MLTMGKTFNREYGIRTEIMNGYYNIGIFFSKRSNFLLFKIEPDFSEIKDYKRNIKISMFKNISASLFCGKFIDLHNYRKDSLDIMNQFEGIKEKSVVMKFNESLILSKYIIHDKDVFDSLYIYGFSLDKFMKEFLFIVAERHFIDRVKEKKIVRTTGLQIATTPVLEFIKNQ